MTSLASGNFGSSSSNALIISSSRLYVPHFPNARMRCVGVPRREKSGNSGLRASSPCARRWTLSRPYLSFKILRYPGMRTETELESSNIRVATAPATW